MALTQIQLAMLADGILTADAAGRLKMADGFVNTAKLLDANVTTAKLADAAVSRAKMGYSGAVLKITNYQQNSLTGSTTSTSFIDSGWSFNVVAERANPIILLDWYFNQSQNDTWTGGTVRWLRSINGGAYNQIAGENGNAGHNLLATSPGNNNRSCGHAFTSFDNISSGVAAGDTINYKLQMKGWSSTNALKIGVSCTDNDTGSGTTTPGFQYFKFTEVAR